MFYKDMDTGKVYMYNGYDPANVSTLCVPMAGLTMGEMFVLDELADNCSLDGRYEFFFNAPPLAITNASGSPLNPLAIK